jgi:DNA helicase-2/ATP-dependent DNA helicase PcrA
MLERAGTDEDFAGRWDHAVRTLLRTAIRASGQPGREPSEGRGPKTDGELELDPGSAAASPDRDPEPGAGDLHQPRPQPLANEDALLADLNEAQREAVTTIAGPVVVLAGAGTGKTRVITRRVAYALATGKVEPGEVLVVAFTEKAAREMADRLAALGHPRVAARTFHSAALRQLRHFWPRVSDTPFPEVLDSKVPLVRAALLRENVPYRYMPLKDFADVIEWAKVRRTPPAFLESEALRVDRALPAPADVVLRVWTGYERAKDRAGRIDFEDLLVRTVELLESREDVVEEVRARYRWFSVDEYQDTNPIQEALLRVWLGERRDVCVVGDPDQTIYSFTGASSDFITTFPRRYPGARIVELRENYRSSRQIIALANRLATRAESGESRLIAVHPAGPDPHLIRFPNEEKEREGLVAQVQHLFAEGVSPAACAVLVRVNAQLAPIEEALTLAGIPHRVRGERFYARRDVRAAMAALTKLPGRRRSAPETDLVNALAEALGEAFGYERGAEEATDAARERQAALDALLLIADDLIAESPSASIDEYLAELARRDSLERNGAADGVTLSTIHRAKGLEWDAVLLPSWEEGLMPHAAAKGPGDIAEERRLAYVAITRARRHLWISWSARRRGPRGGDNARTRSRFLDQIARSAKERPPDRAGTAGKPTPPHTPASIPADGAPSKSRARLTLPLDDPLVVALRQWRSDRATADEVPAFVVFSDSTLLAIAESCPTSATDLTSVKGIGPTKQERYGAEIVAICNEHRP